jgi:hypothetical protein
MIRRVLRALGRVIDLLPALLLPAAGGCGAAPGVDAAAA